jgi:hypothetical protein
MDDHLIVTAPDRYHGEGEKILLVDWNHEQLDNIIRVLRGSPLKLIMHVFGHNDTDLRWLLDVAYQCDVIVINMGSVSAADPIKGHMITWDKSKYYGRKDLSDIFLGYIEDPHGALLAWVGKRSDERNQ